MENIQKIRFTEPDDGFKGDEYGRKIRFWKTFVKFPKKRWKSRGYRPSRFVNKYVEEKKKSRKKSKKILGRCIHKRVPVYKDSRFDEWQNLLAQHIHDGYNLILDVKTSCGKTWAVNLIVGYETLMTDNGTALFIIPNTEILLDNVKELHEQHTKSYQFAGSRCSVEFLTSKWTTLQNPKPRSQILCVSADIVMNILCDPSMEEFIGIS